ncbi:MAG: threonine synthase [Phototrophicales bacterium]|nr:MAG: threonine synthase [Phototrophicales bacterium]
MCRVAPTKRPVGALRAIPSLCAASTQIFQRCRGFIAMKIACMDCNHEVIMGTLGACPACGGILQAHYDDAAINTLIEIQPGRGIDRYRSLMPVQSAIPNLGEGDTPLLKSKRIGTALGLDHLYFKNEGLNPSGAFKDRAGAMVAALAIDNQARGVICASSGNASSAVAAYCAAAGLDCIILMEPGNPVTKLRQTLATGARVIRVEGIFAHGPEALRDMLIDVAQRTNHYLGFIWAPVNPYILEGIKTIAYEIASQLNVVPDAVIAPVGGGDMFTAQWRGWCELHRAGVIDTLPRMIAVQSESAPPLLAAFRNEQSSVETLSYANSKVSGINVAFTGNHALAAVRESNGYVVGVSDDEIFAMQRRIAVEEGIWIEPASAAPVAALHHLKEARQIESDSYIACIMSGAGFKDAKLAADVANTIAQQETASFDAAHISELIGQQLS